MLAAQSSLFIISMKPAVTNSTSLMLGIWSSMFVVSLMLPVRSSMFVVSVVLAVQDPILCP
jgi:hypothetical protein